MTLAISKDKWEVNTTLGEVNYSEDLKYDHLKSGNNQNPDFWKIGFQMVQFSNGLPLLMAIAMVPTI